MRKHFIFWVFLLGVFAVILSSCNTTQTFTVHGTPGTVISKGQQQLAVIDQSGQTTITLKSSDGYYHFLNAQAQGTNIPVPFALDYKDHSRSTEANLFTSWNLILPLIGASGLITGTVIEAKSGGGGSGLTPILIGSAAIVLWVPSLISMLKSDFPDFDYLNDQFTNNDLIR